MLEKISQFFLELHFSKRLSQSPIEIKIIRFLDEEFFRLIRLFKRDSDWKRDHEEKAVERYFNEPQWSNTQNVSQDIP